MEAATASNLGGPDLPLDKATRIIEAMRTSVGELGFAGSTFDHVAREAGVSRGLLHYYFGTKERLLVEAVRRDSEIRLATIAQAVADARDADQVLATLVAAFEEVLSQGSTMFFEVLTLAQRNAEIARELAHLGRRIRAHLADVLRQETDAGVLALRVDPDATASFLLVLADGIIVRRMSEPDLDIAPVMATAVAAARALLG